MKLCDRIKARREELNISQDELAQRLGYNSRSSINKIEKGLNDIPQAKIPDFAKALNTTTEYLMGLSEFTPRDERDIKKKLDEAIASLNDKEALMFDGEPVEMDDETRELLKSSLENSIRIAKTLAKKKYTPKKYRKDTENNKD